MKAFITAFALCFVAVLGAPDLKNLPDLNVDNTLTDAAAAEAEDLTETLKASLSQGNVDDRTRLVADLMSGYNKGVNPDDVAVQFGINLLDFTVRENSNALDSYVWLKIVWQDDRLKWNGDEYGGVQVLRVDSTTLWKPDVTLYNSADPVNMVNCWDSNMLVWSSGKVMFVPPCKMTSRCKFDLKRNPYGEQKCSLKFGSWTFDGNAMDLQFYNKTQSIDLTELNDSTGFEVLSTVAERNVRTYSCCPDPYIDLTFNMTIRRLPGDELFNKF
ncbi:Acetylcholine receptor subunit alpha-L1 [Orchesella cincta]|uniref:Acetylcholine receptor subunit alpha-L1 n=1 Tax=Orchesella cincta TaxID=48709 RepID=A0A1D2N9L2_ORCCI|nr:Acetylcholine receptor subunit alpha-L1 [Orchesella cincta]